MAVKHIVVPVDFSDASETAIRIASHIAERTSARLTLVHVDRAPTFTTLSAGPMYVPPQQLEKMRRDHDAHLKQSLRRLVQVVEGRATATTMLRRDEPVPGILGYAAESDAELIVIGSHGHGATRFLLGSVAEKVARAAPCPVLVVRPDTPEHPSGFRRVLVAIDYSQFSTPSAKLASDYLAPDGQLELVHVFAPPYPPTWGLAIADPGQLAEQTEVLRAAQAERLSQFANALEFRVAPSTFLAIGSPALGIIDRAKETRADLIVLGAHHRDRLSEKIVGTVADRVLRHAPVAVLLLPGESVARPPA